MGNYERQWIGKTLRPEATDTSVILSRKEVEQIQQLAHLCRRAHALSKGVGSFEQYGDGSSPTTRVFQELQRLSGGHVEPTEPLSLDAIAILEQKANGHATTMPNWAAQEMSLAAAALVSRDPQRATELVELGSRYNDVAQTNTQIVSPKQLLPAARLLGVQRQLIAQRSLPTPEQVARAISHARIEGDIDPSSLLEDYALVLPEDQRTAFLEVIPEPLRKEVSVVLDSAVSNVLSDRALSETIEGQQRVAVRDRARQQLEAAIQHPGDAEDRVMVKLLSQTIRELGGEDAKRLLQELGQGGVKRVRDPERHRDRMSYAARIIRELSETDRNTGGMAAMKLLAKKELPDQLFTYFLRRLTQGEAKNAYLTTNARGYIDSTEQREKYLPFLRQLIARYPNQFNTVIDTLTQIPGYDPAEHQVEVFQALEDLDSLTPIIFDRYRRTDSTGKRTLSEKIRQLKPAFFRNTPVRDILGRTDQDILVEMVYLAYKPVGMSFEDVRRLMGKVEDHTEHLEGYRFPEDGYDFRPVSQKKFVVAEGKFVDGDRLRAQRRLLEQPQPADDASRVQVEELLVRIAKAGTEFNATELGMLLSVMSGDEMVRLFVERYAELQPEQYYQYIAELQEIVGIFFDDHYHERLANFLDANPKIQIRVAKMLTKDERVAALKRKLGKDGQNISWDALNTPQTIAKLCSAVLGTKAMKGLREQLRIESNKFVQVDVTEDAVAAVAQDRKLKAYISKNVGSFFAKASAGICTAEDISLFEREDHFHINIVENEQAVRGNIQAYIIDEGKGKQSLVLRGFNPNTDFLDRVDAGAFCEAVLRVARQFQEENALANIYITEPLPGWHALSNREPVTRYLTGKYVKEKHARPHRLQIASSTSISTLYHIPAPVRPQSAGQ